MEISNMVLWLDTVKAMLDLLLEKRVITHEELRKKIIEYHTLTEEQLDEVLEHLKQK